MVFILDESAFLDQVAESRKPTHPGVILREDVLPALGIDAKTFARHAGMATQTLERILREEGSISVPLAQRIGKVCGNGPDIWINMQIKHDLYVTGKNMAVILANIPTLKVKD